MAITKMTDLTLVNSIDDEDLLMLTTNVSTTPNSNTAKFKVVRHGVVQALNWDLIVEDYSQTTFNLFGTILEQATGQTGDYTTDFQAYGAPVAIEVNTIVTGGVMIITGTSVNRMTGVVTTSDTEQITIDTTAGQRYLTSKWWRDVTNIDISTGDIATINYDIELIPMVDMAQRDITLVGMRSIITTNATTSDWSVQVRKIEDSGDGKMALRVIEDIGFTSVGSTSSAIVDNLRTSSDDRSHSNALEVTTSAPMSIRVSDYETYFSSSNYHKVYAGTKNEGLICVMRGQPTGGGMTAIEHIRFTLYFRLGII